MTWQHPVSTGLAVGVAVIALAGCNGGPQVLRGECRQVFGGEVCTFGTLDNGQATDFGATVSMATVENTPERRRLPPANLAPPVASGQQRSPAHLRLPKPGNTRTKHLPPDQKVLPARVEG